MKRLLIFSALGLYLVAQSIAGGVALMNMSSQPVLVDCGSKGC
jgi:hypothetical protein